MLKFQNVLFQQIMKLIFSELQLPGAVLKPIPHINPKQHSGHLLFVAAPTPLGQALQTHVAAAVDATLGYFLILPLLGVLHVSILVLPSRDTTRHRED